MQFNLFSIKSCYVFIISMAASLAVHAQKENDISGGVKAPAVKVDGKSTEWGQLPAYNKTTLLHYVIANDANNLYLAISATDQTSINKMLAGGLTFTINKEGKKKDKDAAVIVYPMVTNGARGFRGMRSRPGEAVDTAALVASRKQTVAGMKELSITGVKDITDTLVSIYNTYGIKTAINFDTKGNLFYELEVPLKLLELDAAKSAELAYNLKLNGMQFGGGREVVIREAGGGQGGGGGFGIRGGGGGGFGGGAMAEMMTPTDFWGKYKLAKP
jgi:hypothetical protein